MRERERDGAARACGGLIAMHSLQVQYKINSNILLVILCRREEEIISQVSDLLAQNK